MTSNIEAEKKVYEFLDDLYYWTKEPGHVWVRKEGRGELGKDKVKIGIDSFAADVAGKALYINLFPIGSRIEQGKIFGIIESGKQTCNIPCPLSGKIIWRNERTIDVPKIINEDPYEEGWLVILETDALSGELKSKYFIHGKDEIDSWMEQELEKFEIKDAEIKITRREDLLARKETD